jgi:hypothetical protein
VPGILKTKATLTAQVAEAKERFFASQPTLVKKLASPREAYGKLTKELEAVSLRASKHQALLNEAKERGSYLQQELATNRRVLEELEAIAADGAVEDDRYAGWDYYEATAWNRPEEYSSQPSYERRSPPSQ